MISKRTSIREKYITFFWVRQNRWSHVCHEVDETGKQTVCGQSLTGTHRVRPYTSIPDGKKLCDHCKAVRERQTAAMWLLKWGN